MQTNNKFYYLFQVNNGLPERYRNTREYVMTTLVPRTSNQTNYEVLRGTNSNVYLYIKVADIDWNTVNNYIKANKFLQRIQNGASDAANYQSIVKKEWQTFTGTQQMKNKNNQNNFMNQNNMINKKAMNMNQMMMNQNIMNMNMINNNAMNINKMIMMNNKMIMNNQNMINNNAMMQGFNNNAMMQNNVMNPQNMINMNNGFNNQFGNPQFNSNQQFVAQQQKFAQKQNALINHDLEKKLKKVHDLDPENCKTLYVKEFLNKEAILEIIDKKTTMFPAKENAVEEYFEWLSEYIDKMYQCVACFALKNPKKNQCWKDFAQKEKDQPIKFHKDNRMPLLQTFSTTDFLKNRSILIDGRDLIKDINDIMNKLARFSIQVCEGKKDRNDIARIRTAYNEFFECLKVNPQAFVDRGPLAFGANRNNGLREVINNKVKVKNLLVLKDVIAGFIGFFK